MFGSSNITSSWGQPQQNQQQAPSAFGQPASTGFGTGSAFGSGGAFGQQQQQQQPQANPMFGNLSTPSTSAGTSSGFGTTGAFGSTTNTSNSGGLFGAPKPATGFGAFGGSGGTSTFGGGPSTAGSSTSGGIFGSTQAAAGSSSFGSGAFGGAKPAGAFGTTQTEAPAPVTTGTASPQYSVYDEKDGLSIIHYQSITCMPAYRGSSFEELRAQDYQQGRKTAGGFGQTTFGQPAQNTGLFGQPAAANTTNPGTSSLFGNTAFSSTSSAPPATNSAFGTFGQSSSNTGATGTGGLFGSSTFGQPQQTQQQPSTGFGAFGQPQQQQQQQQQPAGGGLFSGGGAFGNTQNRGLGAFGSGTTGAFGSAPQQQQQQPAGGLFGSSQQQGTGAFSGFGQNAPKPSIFGTQPAQPTNAFGGFGTQPQQTQQPAQQTSSLFGNSFLNPQQPQGQQPQQSTGLFGTQPAQQQQQTGSGLFGGGGGLFGNTNTQQQQPAQQPAQTGAFGLFGLNKPTTTPAPGGLFGNTFGQSTNTATAPVQPQGSLFGASLGQSVQQAPNAFGTGSLFSKPATNALGTTQTATQPTGSAFGSTLFGSTLGSSTAIPAAAPSLTASIAQPIGANLPLFSMLPPGPRSVALDQSPKKKPSLFSDVPTRSPVPRLQLGYSPATSKLRGFTNTYAGGNGSPLSLSSGKPGALSLSKAASKSLLGPDAFLSNSMSQPGLGSGGRHSVKKLVLDKKVEPSDLFSKSGALKPPKITFNPALSIAARENEASGASIPRRSESPAPINTRKPGLFTANPPLPPPSGPGRTSTTTTQAEDPEPPKLQEGDYYVKPDLSQLRKASHSDLSKFSGLVVGRVGYGEIHFLEDVDLTGLPKLGSLLGDIVRFDDKECCVYPDSDDADKPAPGSGLNVRARIELIRCWALDKATREPIKDAKHPSALRHYKRLRNMKDTHFEGFDIEEGKWTFTVDHF